MERLPPSLLAELMELLPAADIARVTQTCTALRPQQAAVQAAVALVLQRRDGRLLPFLHADDAQWPRSVLMLRCAEVLRVKPMLQAALCSTSGDVAVSRAWVLAWKRRCQAYEQYVLQFRPSKKKTQHQRRQHVGRNHGNDAVGPVGPAPRLVDAERAATKLASRMIVCPHGNLLPLPSCVGRARRATVSKHTFRMLELYAPDVRGFAGFDRTDCHVCVEVQQEAERFEAEKREQRFETQISGSSALVELLVRKKGYPSQLLSPVLATSDPGTHVSLVSTAKVSYYLLPKKWAIRWRKYVRSLVDDAPGPILTADLVCVAHQRTIVPPYITMFLSGFSLETSLQATQALGASVSTQYEIVTNREWEALADRYCAEYAVGFDVENGTFQWKTPECNLCHYGMGNNNHRRERRIRN